jgi:hypothetical protein
MVALPVALSTDLGKTKGPVVIGLVDVLDEPFPHGGLELKKAK